MWTKFHLQHCRKNPCQESSIEPLSLSSAIHLWMEATKINPRSVVQFQDACQGAYCNSECPEEIVLGELSPYWPFSSQVLVIVMVVSISAVCIAVKVCIMVRNLVKHYRNSKYLHTIRRSSVLGVSILYYFYLGTMLHLLCNYFCFQCHCWIQ